MSSSSPSSHEGARWTAQTVGMSDGILDRMERALANVRLRLFRATAALNAAAIPYAVVGGNAVAYWVATVDAGAVRTTRDIDLLIRRGDLATVGEALEGAGFVRDEVLDVLVFRDGQAGLPSEGIHLLFAGEKTRAEHPLPAPEIDTIDDPASFRVISLESLVILKLIANRRKDQVHILDLMGVGLVNASWLMRLPQQLRPRLQAILDTPDE